MAKLISRRYANALFELAQDNNQIDVFYEEVKVVHESLVKETEFSAIINHPQISSGEKLTIFENIFKDKISGEIIGLFSLVIRKNREHELIEILEVFMDRVLLHKGITTAYVYSAKPASQEQLNSIKDMLNKKLNKQVNIVSEVNEELIGGLKILVDGHVIDYTIKRQLDDLTKKLVDIQLA